MVKNKMLAKVVKSKREEGYRKATNEHLSLLSKSELRIDQHTRNKMIASKSVDIYSGYLLSAIAASPIMRGFQDSGEDIIDSRLRIMESYIISVYVKGFRSKVLVERIMENVIIGGLQQGIYFDIEKIMETVDSCIPFYGNDYRQIKGVVLNLNNMFHYLSEQYSNDINPDNVKIKDYLSKIEIILTDFFSMRANITGNVYEATEKNVVLSDAQGYKYFTRHERNILNYFSHSVSDVFYHRCIELNMNFVGFWQYTLEQYKNNKF